jgi:site-specific DNA-cytosine methylase
LECVEAFKREHERVQKDLDRAGYGISKPLITDAASLGAPHSRRRYWAIGYSYDEGQSMCNFNAEMAVLSPVDAGPWWENPPPPLGMDDGVADRVYRFRATGNGQVPVQSAAAFLMLGGPVNV